MSDAIVGELVDIWRAPPPVIEWRGRWALRRLHDEQSVWIEMRIRLIPRIPVVLLALLALAGAPVALAQAPPNDAFNTPQPLSGASGRVDGTNEGATKEPGEPRHAGKGGGASVWYRWTAPMNGGARFDTNGSDIDTLLAVYQGASVNALTRVAANDDSGGDLASRVTFPIVAGAEYVIAVDGFDGAEGRFRLRWTSAPPPANDNFDQATMITGARGTVRGSVFAATREAGEPHVKPSVWFRWTAPRTGRVSFAPRSPFSVVAYTGSSLATVARVATGIGEPAAFSGIAGTTYTLAVTGRGERFPLSWGPPPANDDFRNARAIAGVRGRVIGTNVLATREAREPAHFGRASESVWYRWRAPRTGRVIVTTSGSSFDTVLAAYVGRRLTGLRRIARNDDDESGLDSVIAFRAARGVLYRIAVDGYTRHVGRISLRWQLQSALRLAGRQ